MAEVRTPRAEPGAKGAAHFDVFLSYNSRDRAIVERIAERLKRSGLEPWLDKWSQTPGGEWQQELGRGIEASHACAVFVGPSDLGAWGLQELAFALDRSTRERDFRVFPVLLPGVREPFDATVLPHFLRTRTWVDYRRGYGSERALQELIAAVKGVPFGPSVAIEPWTGIRPYRGLQPFGEEDAKLFFGRDREVQRLVEMLKGARFLAVVGASGSGKSSLVRAGLVPALRAGALPEVTDWTVCVLEPGADPLGILAARLVSLGNGEGMQATLDALGDDPRTLHLASALALSTRPNGERLLLVVDQLEETFTLASDEEALNSFFENLIFASSAAGGRCTVAVTLRSDFYPRLAAYSELAQHVAGHQFLLTPMERDGLRQVIEEPARLAGMEFESGLVETILDDVARQPGALPLLEHALLELWERRRGRMLTLEGYRESGGVSGALATRAEAIYGGFDGERKAVAKRVLLRLTQPGEGTEDTRRQATMNELVTRSEEADALEEVVGELAHARMLTVGGQGRGEEPRVDVSHEALIRAWPRLRGWIDEDRAGLRVQRRITEAAQEWNRLARDPGALLRGARLAEAVEWHQRRPAELNDLESRFLEASEELRSRERNEVESRRLKELEEARRLASTERRAKLLLRGVVAILLAGTLVSVLAAVIALNQRGTAVRRQQEANKQAQLALARQLTVQSTEAYSRDLGLGLLIAVAAAHFERGPQTRAALVSGLTRYPRLVGLTHQPEQILALDVDGRTNTFTAVSQDGTVARWSLDTMRRQGRIHRVGEIASAALSADGRRLAAATGDGRARIWDLPSMRRLGPEWRLARDRSSFKEGGLMQLSRDGRRLFADDLDSSRSAWRITPAGRATRIRLSRAGSSSQLASLGSDGRSIAYALADNRTIAVEDLARGRVRSRIRLSRDQDPTSNLALSPDGQTVALYDVFANRLLLVDVSSRAVRSLPLDGFSLPRSIAFSADSHRVALSLEDGRVTVWDRRTGKRLGARFSALPATGSALAFEPDGRTLLSGGIDGTIARLATNARPALATTRSAHDPEIIELSPDAEQLATGGRGIQLWPLGSGRSTRTLGTGHVQDIAFSGDGRTVAAATQGVSGNGSVHVWRLPRGDALMRGIRVPKGHPPRSVALNRDGTMLAIGADSGRLSLWRLSPGRATPWGRPLAAGRPTEPGFDGPDQVTFLRFSADERTLYAHQGTELTAWRLSNRHPTRLAQDVVDSVLDPEARTVAATDAGGTVWSWSPRRNHQRGDPLVRSKTTPGTTSGVDMAVSDDGRWLATTDDTDVTLWDARSHEAVGRIPFDPIGRPYASFTDVAVQSPGPVVYVATDSERASLTAWDLSFANLTRLACRFVNRNLTRREWRHYIGAGTPYQRLCHTNP